METIRPRFNEMARNVEEMHRLSTEVKKRRAGFAIRAATVFKSLEKYQERDMRSVYVGNVDYCATNRELEFHFLGCGEVRRANILCNKDNGMSRGFAYIEFAEKRSAKLALAMNDTYFRGRQIRVMGKRTNIPKLYPTNPRSDLHGQEARISRPSELASTRATRRPKDVVMGTDLSIHHIIERNKKEWLTVK